MAAISEDFLVCDDMDAIFSLIEEDIAWEDENFVVEVNNIVGNETTPDSGFPDFHVNCARKCAKVSMV